MGQTIGKSTISPTCARLNNLPGSLVRELWEAFNDIAEGFGLSIDEVKEILKISLMDHFKITERMINKDAEAVFRILDDDEVLYIYIVFILYIFTYIYVIFSYILWLL